MVQLTTVQHLFFAWTVESHLCVYVFKGSQHSLQIFRVLSLCGSLFSTFLHKFWLSQPLWNLTSVSSVPWNDHTLNLPYLLWDLENASGKKSGVIIVLNPQPWANSYPVCEHSCSIFCLVFMVVYKRVSPIFSFHLRYQRRGKFSLTPWFVGRMAI